MNIIYQKLLNKSIKRFNWVKVPTKLFERDNKSKLYNWYPDGELNIGYNCLDKHIKNNKLKDKAIIYESPLNNESGFYSYKQLYRKVNTYCYFLNKLGLSSKDNIVIYMPNIPESLMFKLALSKLNITYHSICIFTGMNELSKRLKTLKPKLVITTSSGMEINNIIDLVDNLNKIYKEEGEIKTVVLQRDIKKSKLKGSNFVDLENEIEKLNCDSNEILEQKTSNQNLYIFKNEDNNEYLIRDHKGYAISSILSMQRNLGVIENDVVLCTNYLSTSLGQTYSLYGPLLWGATSLIIENELEKSKDYLELIEKHGVNILLGKENLLDNILENKNVKENLNKSSLKTIVYHDLEDLNTKKPNFKNIHTCKMLYKNEIGYPILINSFIENEEKYKINYGINFKIINDNLYLKPPYFPSLFKNTFDKNIDYLNKNFKDNLYDLGIKLKNTEDNTLEVLHNEENDFYYNLYLKININSIEKMLDQDKNILKSYVIVDDKSEDKEELIIFIKTNNPSIFDNTYYKTIINNLKDEFGKQTKIKKFLLFKDFTPKSKEILENFVNNQEESNNKEINEQILSEFNFQ